MDGGHADGVHADHLEHVELGHGLEVGPAEARVNSLAHDVVYAQLLRHLGLDGIL